MRIFTKDGKYIAIAGGSDQAFEEIAANARMMAAAPELLEACKMLAAYADQECMHVADRLSQGWSPEKSHDSLAEAVIAAQDAIRKATGASP